MKLDLHVHTKYSKDSFSSAYKILKQAKKKGLNGIAITDHNTTKGWPAAIEAAKKLNLLLILGEEIKCKEGIEIIGLFLKKEIKPDCLDNVLKEIKKQKGVAILAHPFYKKNSFHEIEGYVKKLDGFEILNSRRTQMQNKKAKMFYHKLPYLKKRVAIVAGSDSHAPFEVGTAFTACHAKDLNEFKKELLKRRTYIYGKRSPWTVHIISTLANLRINKK